MPRRPWTRAEIEAMVKGGIIDEDERFEMIGGEVVPMSPKGARHELVKIILSEHLHRMTGRDIWVGQETTLWLDEISFVEPDFCIWPRAIAPGDMRGHDVLLAIEVADTSLAYDRGRKIALYAAYGTSEVWVIEANSLLTRVHRRLGAVGYREIFDTEPDGDLIPDRVPSLRVNLAELGLAPL
jgi:Uma2 family endonuclease